MKFRVLLLLAITLVTWSPNAIAQEDSAGDGGYVIGSDDVLGIQVWGREDLTGEVVVDFEGNVQIPLLGQVTVAGRTPGELSRDLTRRMQLLDTSVTEVLVAVNEYKSQSVTVIGEVRGAGEIGFRELPGLWEAILTAGGPTPNAELSRVQLIRVAADGQTTETFNLDLSPALEGLALQGLPKLQPKDRILVPSVSDVPTGSNNINVIGAVNSPGVYRLTAGIDIVTALTVAGGPNPKANLKKVFLSRPTGQGSVSYELNLLGYLEVADPMSNLELLAGDTILVPEKSSFLQNVSTFLARLAPIASLVVTIILATN